jgi:hypothetical protein
MAFENALGMCVHTWTPYPWKKYNVLKMFPNVC